MMRLIEKLQKLRIFLIRVLNKLGILSGLNFNFSMRVNGTRFLIPLRGGSGLSHLYQWEPWMITVLKQVLPASEGLFVDVGANLGQTLVNVKSIDPNRPYIGFEPNAACLYYLEHLIDANNLIDTKVLPVGLAQATGVATLSLYNPASTDGAGSIVPDFRPSNKIYGQKLVPVFKSSDLPSDWCHGKMGILKIDIEGAEYEALAQLENIISRDRPIIIIEILPVYRPENADRLERQHKIEALLQRIRYIMYRVHTKSWKLQELHKITSIGVHDQLSDCNYVFAPIERSAELD
ncbi:MAG: FkbM family methyltransferase [Saprospiraceae bacterium]|nr:FkbM family methyltransferase [Saprospiraceae bacterium]